MKKLLVLPVIAMLSVPAFSTTTTTTSSSVMDDSEMIEAQEEGYDDETLDSEDVSQQRMEDRNQNSSIRTESEDAIDYGDRTRTNRERKALNTGSDASDDQ